MFFQDIKTTDRDNSLSWVWIQRQRLTN